jgi:hypothetical protein
LSYFLGILNMIANTGTSYFGYLTEKKENERKEKKKEARSQQGQTTNPTKEKGWPALSFHNTHSTQARPNGLHGADAQEMERDEAQEAKRRRVSKACAPCKLAHSACDR